MEKEFAKPAPYRFLERNPLPIMQQRIFVIALLCGLSAVANAQGALDKTMSSAHSERDDGRALRALSQQLFAAGDYDGAMKTRWQMLGISDSNSPLHALTSYAIQSLALNDIQLIASHLNATSARHYAAQLLAWDKATPTYTNLLKKQEMGELKWLDELTKDTNQWQKMIPKLGIGEQDQNILEKIPVSKIKSNIEKIYGEAIQNSMRPYKFSVTKLSVDPYTRYFAMPSASARFLWTRAKTQRLLVVAALQARADRLEKKPVSAPLPLDPFGGKPLQQKGAMIYSIGPDGVNNGGVAAPEFNSFEPTYQGDILAPAL